MDLDPETIDPETQILTLANEQIQVLRSPNVMNLTQKSRFCHVFGLENQVLLKESKKASYVHKAENDCKVIVAAVNELVR